MDRPTQKDDHEQESKSSFLYFNEFLICWAGFHTPSPYSKLASNPCQEIAASHFAKIQPVENAKTTLE